MNDRLLASYINNHLAGSVAGIELARRCLVSSRGTELGIFLQQLVHEMEEERSLLKQLLDKLGLPEQSVKKLGAWVFEKLGEIAIGDYARKHPALAQVFELEGVLLGSTARHGLWTLLEICRGTDERINFIDFGFYRSRAEKHCRELERHRQMAARGVFTYDASP